MMDQFLLHRSRNSGRDLLGETDSFVGQLLLAHLWYKVQDPFSVCSPVSKTMSFFISHNFNNRPVFASQIKTQEEICWVKPTPLWVSCYSSISFTKSKNRSAYADSPVSKTSFSFNFNNRPVFASQIETQEEICWVKPTPLRVSSYSPISCTKSKIRSAHADSPDS